MNLKNTSKYGVFFAIALPFVTQCSDKKEGDVTGYVTPGCDEGQYYDGILGECRAPVAPVAVTGFTSFRDENFDDRGTKLASFITTYFATGFTFSVAPTCTESVEYNAIMNAGAYAAGHDLSYDCSFTLLDAAGAEKLVFKTQDTSVATPIAKDEDGADAEGTERPEYASPFLKVVISKDTDLAKVLLCTYTSERKGTFLDAAGKYDDSVESDDVFATNTKCVPYGASPAVPASMREETDATLIAFPYSLTSYLRGKRTKDIVGGVPVYKHADEAVSTTIIDTLNVDCGTDGAFNLAATFTPSPKTPVTGTVVITGDPTTFFNASEVEGVDGFTYIKARNLLGCSEAECLTGADVEGTYAVVGNYVYVTFGSTDVWKYTVGNKTLAFASNSGGKAAVCDYGYTLKPKE